jgi:hypothetical protein
MRERSRRFRLARNGIGDGISFYGYGTLYLRKPKQRSGPLPLPNRFPYRRIGSAGLRSMSTNIPNSLVSGATQGIYVCQALDPVRAVRGTSPRLDNRAEDHGNIYRDVPETRIIQVVHSTRNGRKSIFSPFLLRLIDPDSRLNSSASLTVHGKFTSSIFK